MAEKTNFIELVKKIYQKQILLPDFQRRFVWSDEERQRKVVASVLARMPIGSILLLKSDPNEFQAKQIGSRLEADTEDLKNEVEFLLDGQQRVTVLTNVFSDAIHLSTPKTSNLISRSLNRRFFLKIPKWKCCTEENDRFGLKNLEFRYRDLGEDDPDLLTEQILDFITYDQYGSKKTEPFEPCKGYGDELVGYCVTPVQSKDYYLLPLFLMINTNRRDTNIEKMYERILKAIGNAINEELEDAYEKSLDRREFLNNLNLSEDDIERILSRAEDQVKPNEWRKGLFEEETTLWIKELDEYLRGCLTQMKLNIVKVEKAKRARAIDIYENMNRGGVSLNTFDLIMAKVAKVSSEPFYQRLINEIQKEKEYTTDTLPEQMQAGAGGVIKNRQYNALVEMHALEKENSISGIYINTFLNVMALYCDNEELDVQKISIKRIKKDQILGLDPKKIDKNCELVCRALDRACFFLQTRCGLRTMQEINYNHILTLTAVIFTQDKWFACKEVSDLLEAWYWSAIFSGEFDRDQNVRFESNLCAMIETIKKEKTTDWIEEQKNKVLDAKYFSEKSFLLLEDVEITERYPKRVLRYFIAQYYLSKTYPDMFDTKKRISTFMENSDLLEMHHIIPLASAKTVKESDKLLNEMDNENKKVRNRKDEILNSPLNFIYILRDTNKVIGAKSIQEYQKIISNEAFAQLNFGESADASTPEGIKAILSARHKDTQGEIKDRIARLLDIWNAHTGNGKET